MKARRALDLSACTRTVRLAVLSDAAVPQLAPLLEVLLAQQQVRAEIHLGEYDATELEVLDPKSALYEFRPDVIVILNSTNALRLKYYGSAGDRAGFADEVATRIAALWDTIASRSSALVAAVELRAALRAAVRQLRPQGGGISVRRRGSAQRPHHGFGARPRARPDQRRRGLGVVRRAQALVRRAHVDAVQGVLRLRASAAGGAEHRRRRPGQRRACGEMPRRSISTTPCGAASIGDDGLEGIAIGPYGDGEPYHRLQFYLRELKRRGIILAVCSKNEHATALEPFRSHPEMVLREEDIAVFVANWSPKPDNIRAIRAALNIGYDSMVFLDDNPFERNLVREQLPGVIVPELPEDASDYVRAIAELNLFEATSFSEEDRRRADLYRTNAERQRLESECTDIGAYLRSLDMRITFARFDDFHLTRIAQLLQRSNQFNLTTRRYNLAECRAMMADEAAWMPWYAKLADRFGDNGLISVVILKRLAAELVIDAWLMSCRVLGRGVEAFAMNRVVEFARAHGYRTVTGHYLPTAKNGMVKEFYAQFGFDKVDEGPAGEATWRLDVAAYAPREVPMVAVESAGNGANDGA